MKKIGKIFLTIFLLNMFLLPVSRVEAAEATLFLSPSSGTYTEGATFIVDVKVNSGGETGINASDAAITFDKDLLAVKKVSNTGSIFNLWTADPSFSNTAGTINYSGGSPSAYKGSAGTIMSITFSALKVGAAKVSFSSGTVLAADGKGTNILKGNSGAVFNIEAKKEEPKVEEPKKEMPKKEDVPKEETTVTDGILPPPPKVSSITHSEEDVWYPNSNPEFQWKLLSDISGISMSLNKDETSDPQDAAGVVVETQKFENVPDGVNYFHIKFKNRYGWGPISDRKVMIDVTPPKEFDITIDFGSDPTNPSPGVKFESFDETSGIMLYRMELDGEGVEMTQEEFAIEPYKFPILQPGQHTLIVTSIDYAGNKASSSKTFIIDSLKAPVITQMPRILDKNEELVVQGTSFYANATIKVFISKDDEEVATIDTKTDSGGAWSYFHKTDLPKGTFQVWAKVVDDRGAESDASLRKVLTVQSPSIVCAYGNLIIAFLLLIIIGLVIMIVYLRRQFAGQKERAIRETRELEQRLGDVFTALKEEVAELIEFADKKPGISESEKRVKDKITEALDISQEFISKEVKDVEKEIQ